MAAKFGKLPSHERSGIAINLRRECEMILPPPRVCSIFTVNSKPINLITGARDFLAVRMARRDSILLVAETNGSPLAGLAQLYHGLSSLSISPAMVLNDLFVSQKHRRRGVAAALLGAARGRQRMPVWRS